MTQNPPGTGIELDLGRVRRYDTPMPGRIEIIRDPYNAETPAARLDGTDVAGGGFFVRPHFAVPAIDARSFRLTVGGAVDAPGTIDLAALEALPRRTLR